MAKVFISYATKCEYSVKATALLHAEWEKPGSGYDPFVDRLEIMGGDNWKEEILWHLWESDIVIFLYSTDALKSDWVQFETAAIAFRHVRQKDMLVLPVLLEGVNTDQLKEGFFSPTYFSTIQTIKWPDKIEGCLGARVEEIVKLVNLKFPPSKKSQEDPWVKCVADHLAKAGQGHFEACAGHLGVTVNGKYSNGRRDHLSVAAQFMLAYLDYKKVVHALRELKGHITSEVHKELLDDVAPQWVDPVAASEVPTMVKKPAGSRMIAINCVRGDLAVDYIHKGMGGHKQVTICACEVGFDSDELLQRFKTAMRDRLCFDEDVEIDDQAVCNNTTTVFLIAGLNAEADSKLLGCLVKAFPSVAVIVVTVLDPKVSPFIHAQHLDYIEPRLDEARLQVGKNFQREIKMIRQGK